MPEKPKATPAVHNRIALVFDFDETLAPDSFAALLKHCGYDPESFEEEKIEPLLENNWDKKLARFYVLADESRHRDDLTITAETFAEVGRNLELYPEVEEMFDRVVDYAQDIIPDIEVEFYLLTAGMLEIPRATSISDRFRTMWGGELFFDEEDGELTFVKHTVSYPDKIRYVLKLCKGMDIDHPKITQDVYRELPSEEWYLPLSQLIYVGDGDSDMPVFAYLAEHDGLSIGVFKSDGVSGWEGYEDIHEGQRVVENLAGADYQEDSELMRSIKFSVQSICKEIALRQMGKGE
jgi:phosphoglycolate phosphatase-like HAD superfamily hydrolase